MDPEVQIFLDTIEALGLEIQNSFKHTHRSGYSLDLVMTEVLGKLNVLECQSGPYLAHHCSIMTQVSMERMDIEERIITYRKVNKIDTGCMSDEIKSHLEGLQHLDLNKMVRKLNSILAKSLDKHAPEKTSQVSNLSFMSKIVEKCTLIRVNNHCNVHNMLPQYQSAYHKFHSCETALTKLVNSCLWAMGDQEVTALVAIDLSAAFGTVDHGILLDVLNVTWGYFVYNFIAYLQVLFEYYGYLLWELKLST